MTPEELYEREEDQMGAAEWAIELRRKARDRVQDAELELAAARLYLKAAERNLDIVAPRRPS
jgi:hypothetical protein